MIVFRDFENLVSESNEVNLVVALHDYIGNLKSVDFAIDNADYDSGQMIGQLTQKRLKIFIKRLPSLGMKKRGD